MRSVPCAGFRQCGSNTGLTGLNPKANKWDAPLELRCAQNDNLTKWGPPDYIFPVYYYRGLPCALPSPSFAPLLRLFCALWKCARMMARQVRSDAAVEGPRRQVVCHHQVKPQPPLFYDSSIR